MDCKVRYFLSYYMQLALKYISFLFIICSRAYHANTLCFLSCSRRCHREERDWGHKQRKLLRMSMTILRNSASVNRLKDLWNEPLMPQDFHVHQVAMERESWHWWSCFFVKSFFSEPWWLYSCLKSQKTIPGYYFNNNNCYNRTPVI